MFNFFKKKKSKTPKIEYVAVSKCKECGKMFFGYDEHGNVVELEITNCFVHTPSDLVFKYECEMYELQN